MFATKKTELASLDCYLLGQHSVKIRIREITISYFYIYRRVRDWKSSQGACIFHFLKYSKAPERLVLGPKALAKTLINIFVPFNEVTRGVYVVPRHS